MLKSVSGFERIAGAMFVSDLPPAALIPREIQPPSSHESGGGLHTCASADSRRARPRDFQIAAPHLPSNLLVMKFGLY